MAASLEGTPRWWPRLHVLSVHAGIGSEEENENDSTANALEGGVGFGVYEIDCRADGSSASWPWAMRSYVLPPTHRCKKVALKMIRIDIAERTPTLANALREPVQPQRSGTKTSPSSPSSECALRQDNIFMRSNSIEGETLEERVRASGARCAHHYSIRPAIDLCLWQQRKNTSQCIAN